MVKLRYDPMIGVGPLKFEAPFQKFFAGYPLHLKNAEGRSFGKSIYDHRIKGRIKSESWEVGDLNITLTFGEDNLLKTILDGESFVFLGTEIIGLRENMLCDYFGNAIEIEPIGCGLVFYDFLGDILILTNNGYVNSITVGSYSMPFPKRKRLKKSLKTGGHFHDKDA
ncbi:hypothetical protein AGMMS50243_28810 [Betaproteobacteria bacterium]|nr:hypothetical protein AGMMS50243_28810 [Betaproteobacteria bacterium]